MFQYEFFTRALIILCIFWLQIQIAKTDDLQFWKRDPKFWAGVYPSSKDANAVGSQNGKTTDKTLRRQVFPTFAIMPSSDEARSNERRVRYQEDHNLIPPDPEHLSFEDASTEDNSLDGIPIAMLGYKSSRKNNYKMKFGRDGKYEYNNKFLKEKPILRMEIERFRGRGRIRAPHKLRIDNQKRAFRQPRLLNISLKHLTPSWKLTTTVTKNFPQLHHHFFRPKMRHHTPIIKKVTVRENIKNQSNIIFEKETLVPNKMFNDSKEHSKQPVVNETNHKKMHYVHKHIKRHHHRSHKTNTDEIRALENDSPPPVTKAWEEDISHDEEEESLNVNETPKEPVVELKLKNHKHKKWPGRSKNKPGKLRAESPRIKPKSYMETNKLHPFSIRRQLQGILKKYSVNATIEEEVIGRTVEYNDIVLLKIQENCDNFRRVSRKRETKYADDKVEKKVVFIVHGLVVMGWSQIKCLSEFESFKTLLGYYMDNLDSFDIYLIPMANPDGVAMAEIHKVWNKNASPQKACPGVNLDRNFDVAWNDNLTKGSSCSNNYPGLRAFSENESRAIKTVFERYNHKMVAFFHVHAGSFDTDVFKGDAVLYPKGYTETQGDEDRYVDLRGEIEEAMRNTSFKTISVTVDSIQSWYGTVYGTSVDYASTIYGIPYSLELVMQIYEDNHMVSDEKLREQNTALTEIWQTVLDVIFDTIYRSVIKPNEKK